MDKVWYRNPSKSEVIGRYGGVEKNPNDHDKKSNTKKLSEWSNLQAVILVQFTSRYLIYILM